MRGEPQGGWCRGQQKSRAGPSEERGPGRLQLGQYLGVSHKVINIGLHLTRVLQGPLRNHLLVLLGVIGSGWVDVEDNFANDLQQRGRGEGAGEAGQTELGKSRSRNEAVGQKQPLSPGALPCKAKIRDGLSPPIGWGVRTGQPQRGWNLRGVLSEAHG